jgi:dUTP pyrophosphatase
MSIITLMSVEVRFLLESGARLPAYQTPGAAGLDLCSIEEVVLAPMERRAIRTGLRLAIPAGYEGQIRARSGLALRHGLALVNAPGTIDADYRGELQILMINLGSDVVQLRQGERLAQLVISPVVQAQIVEVTTLDETERGDGGFGSTGSQ